MNNSERLEMNTKVYIKISQYLLNDITIKVLIRWEKINDCLDLSFL